MIKEKVKKELCLLLAVMLLATMLIGCSSISTAVINEDASGSYEEALTLPKTMWDMLFSESGTENTLTSYLKTAYPSATVKIEDADDAGTAVKKLTMNMDFKNTAEFQQLMSSMDMTSVKFSNKYFSRSGIYMPLEDTEDASMLDQLGTLFPGSEEIMGSLTDSLTDSDIRMTITFPYPVTDTNGKTQADGKTVVWDYKELEDTERIYATFGTQDAKSVPSYSGAANGKNYNTGVTLTVNSKNLLDEVTVNDKTTQSDYLFLSADGFYNITATDVNGGAKSIKFRIDTVKPTIKGAANGRTYKTTRTITFSDKGSGIQKATLNGKGIKSGTKITKKGSYTLSVTDKAGNVKTIKFKISK